MTTALIYVPVPRSHADLLIAPGSGIVGFDKPASEYTVVYYEGSTLGASNMVRYEDRIKNSAGRLFTRYPTVALHRFMRAELAHNLIVVGTIDDSYQIVFTDSALATEYGYGKLTFQRRHDAGLPRLELLSPVQRAV